MQFMQSLEGLVEDVPRLLKNMKISNKIDPFIKIVRHSTEMYRRDEINKCFTRKHRLYIDPVNDLLVNIQLSLQ